MHDNTATWAGVEKPCESRGQRVPSLENLFPMYSKNFKALGRRELVISLRLWLGCWDLVNKNIFTAH